MKQLIQACRANDVTDLILLSEHRGNPGNYIHLLDKIDKYKVMNVFHAVPVQYLFSVFLLWLSKRNQ